MSMSLSGNSTFACGSLKAHGDSELCSQACARSSPWCCLAPKLGFGVACAVSGSSPFSSFRTPGGLHPNAFMKNLGRRTPPRDSSACLTVPAKMGLDSLCLGARLEAASQSLDLDRSPRTFPVVIDKPMGPEKPLPRSLRFAKSETTSRE